jgi:hypothetical protein
MAPVWTITVSDYTVQSLRELNGIHMRNIDEHDWDRLIWAAVEGCRKFREYEPETFDLVMKNVKKTKTLCEDCFYLRNPDQNECMDCETYKEIKKILD